MTRTFQTVTLFVISFLLGTLVNGHSSTAQEISANPEYYIPSDDTANLSGVLSISDGGSTTDFEYDVRSDGDAIFQGDIILGDFGELSQLGSNRLNLASLQDPGLLGLFRRGNVLWPKGVVRFEIDESAPNKSAIFQAMDHWSRKTAVQFLEADGTGNYVRFVLDPNNGCSSSVGMVGGRQFIKLGRSCLRGNIIHEIGHALGLGHEQMRSDRDNFISVQTDNIIPKRLSQFTKKPTLYMDQGTYNYDSIMHYDAYAFSKNNKPTIVSPRPIGQRNYLSAGDIAVINSMYQGEFAKR